MGPRLSRILGLATLAVVSFPNSAQKVDPTTSLAPYVPSPQPIVEKMLEAAQIKPGETVYDLGCGDGRILVTAVEKFGAQAVGVELSPELAKLATEKIKQLGLDGKAKVIHGNMLDVDLSPADVVTLYLLTSSNDRIRPNLEKYLKPGARIVSHDFQMRGWKPVRVERIAVHNRFHMIYVYQRPKR